MPRQMAAHANTVVAVPSLVNAQMQPRAAALAATVVADLPTLKPESHSPSELSNAYTLPRPRVDNFDAPTVPTPRSATLANWGVQLTAATVRPYRLWKLGLILAALYLLFLLTPLALNPMRWIWQTQPASFDEALTTFQPAALLMVPALVPLPQRVRAWALVAAALLGHIWFASRWWSYDQIAGYGLAIMIAGHWLRSWDEPHGKPLGVARGLTMVGVLMTFTGFALNSSVGLGRAEPWRDTYALALCGQAVLALLTWLPARLRAGFRGLAWLAVLTPMFVALGTLVYEGDIANKVAASPHVTLVPWVPFSVVLLGFSLGIAGVLGSNRE